MEFIDILDEFGNPTGVIKRKEEAHAQGLWHKTVHIWCVNSKNEILLQYRSAKMVNWPNRWDISVGGHIDSGETEAVAALREIKEEIGVDIDVSELELISTIKHQSITNNQTYFDNEFSDIYLVRLDLSLNELQKQEAELDDLKWVKISEFKKMIESSDPSLVPHPEEYEILLKRLPAKLFDYLSVKRPSRALNEDHLLVSGNLFGVFDGATGLDKYVDEQGRTGGYLASQIAQETFGELGAQMNLRDCALEANNRIRQAMTKNNIDFKQKENAWATTASVVKLHDDYFEWLGISDSPILLVYNDQTFKVLYYQEHDLPTLVLAQELIAKQNQGILKIDSLWSELFPQIMAVRKRANIDYGVMDGDPAMERFLASGQESLENVKYILIFSDGLLIPKKDPRAPEEFGKIVDNFCRGAFNRVLTTVRDLENSDPQCFIYPRTSPYDDASGVAISFV